jgi:hypothetical protein
MKRLLIILAMTPPAISAAIAEQAIVMTTPASVSIVNVWCEANGVRWGERGPTCHANKAERQPVICAGRDGTGAFVTDRGVFCSIPAGWEKSDMGGR